MLFACCFISATTFAQKLVLEPVISIRSTNSESNFISISDTLFAFENNNHSANRAISLGLKLNYASAQKLSFSTGIEYYTSGVSFNIFNDDDCQFCPIQKGGGAYSYTFILPQQVNYMLYKSGNWSLFGIAGVTPIVNLNKDQPTVFSDNRGLSVGVAEVMNALPSTTKPLYIDYNLGFKAKYQRLNFYLHYQENISNSTSKALEIYGRSYPFRRTTRSIVLSLGYDLFNWPKELN